MKPTADVVNLRIPGERPDIVQEAIDAKLNARIVKDATIVDLVPSDQDPTIYPVPAFLAQWTKQARFVSAESCGPPAQVMGIAGAGNEAVVVAGLNGSRLRAFWKNTQPKADGSAAALFSTWGHAKVWARLVGTGVNVQIQRCVLVSRESKTGQGLEIVARHETLWTGTVGQELPGGLDRFAGAVAVAAKKADRLLADPMWVQ